MARSRNEQVRGEEAPRAGARTGPKGGSEALQCLVDVRYGRGDQFEFVVALRGRDGRVRLGVDALEDVDGEQRHWLLSRFRAHLRALFVVHRLSAWVLDRLSLLKEYCEARDMQFEELHRKSALPSGLDSALYTDEAAQCGHGDNARAQRTRSKSVSERAGDTARGVARPKEVRMRTARDSLRLMLAKHGSKRRIDRDALLAELDQLRAHIYDM